MRLRGVILVGGSVGGQFGRKHRFFFGVIFFTVDSIWCGIATFPCQIKGSGVFFFAEPDHQAVQTDSSARQMPDYVPWDLTAAHGAKFDLDLPNVLLQTNRGPCIPSGRRLGK